MKTDVLYTKKNCYILIIMKNMLIHNSYKIEKIKIYWSKEHNSSSNFRKSYIFDKNFTNSAWTVFRLPFFNNLFEVI